MRKQNLSTEYPHHLFRALNESGSNILVKREAVSRSCTPFLCENKGEPVTGGVYSSLHIHTFQYHHDTGQFQLEADLAFAEKCRTITMYADLYDVQRECLINRFKPVTVQHTSHMEYQADGNFKEKFAPGDTAAVLVYADLVEESGSCVEVTAYENEQGYEITHVMEHPQKQEHFVVFGKGSSMDAPEEFVSQQESKDFEKAGKDVKIALWRLPSKTDDLDYLCNFGKMDPSKGNHPILGLPVKGELSIDIGQFYEDSNHLSNLYCVITGDGFDGAKVIATGKDTQTEYRHDVAYELHGSRLTYDLTGSWEEGYMQPGNWRQFRYSYALIFEGFYKTDPHGDILRCKYSVASGGMVNGDILQGTAPYIIIEWGCLDEDTMIAMADGTQKKICEIVIGERIAAADGSSRGVANIWKGTEKESCYKITTANGQCIIATGNHPFPTADGWKNACDLKKGDQMLAADGEVRLVADVNNTNKMHEVYNLELEEPAVLIANGLQTGDFSAQNGQFSKP